MIQYIKHLAAFLLLIYSGNNAYSWQNCDCEKEFLFVKSYIETNYAGFADKVVSSNVDEYNAFSKSQLEKAKTTSKEKYCFYIVKTWLDYFKDNHVQLVRKPGKPNQNDITEQIKLTPERISEIESKPLADIEGIYLMQSKAYKVALIKDKTSFRDYVGIILDASSKLWKPGQVKFELTQLEEDRYRCLYFMQDHEPRVRYYTIKNGRFDPVFFTKTSVFVTTDTEDDPEPFSKLENKNKAVYYKDINDSTAYLRIKSFDSRFAKDISKEIEANNTKLKSKPYLILDLRYNGGGSDFSYKPLMPIIYTNPIKTIGVDIYSTPENIIAWQKILDENPKLPEEVKNELSDVILQMKDNPNQLVNSAKDKIDTLDRGYTFPRKIAILIDEDCASSTEQFLLAAKQSKKVILMGQPSSGTLDYSNMRLIDLSCMPYILAYATSRSRRIPDGAIDEEGIIPDVRIDFSKAWLNLVLENLQD